MFFFYLSPFAPENLVSLDRFGPSRVSSFILHTLRLNLALAHGIPNALRDGVQLYCYPSSGQSRVYRVTQLRTNGAHCLESRRYRASSPNARSTFLTEYT